MGAASLGKIKKDVKHVKHFCGAAMGIFVFTLINSCWLWFHFYSTDMRLVLSCLFNSQQESEHVHFPNYSQLVLEDILKGQYISYENKTACYSQ